MGRKNRNKNKKKKESDGSTGNVNGSSSSNNNKNNDITIPTMGATAATTTTTTIVLTTEEIDRIDNTLMLMGYPKSNDFLVGYRHYTANQNDLAIASFKRGAENDSCVPCMFCYVSIQLQSGNFHLAIPYVLEGAIRGHVMCMSRLVDCYQKTKPAFSPALAAIWLKMMNVFGDYNDEEERREIKKQNATICVSCGKKESEDNDVTLVTCGICKCYSYCGKNCQTRHWKEGKHMNECRQVILLRKYCKPSYVKEIREAIIDGQDPKEIHTLQRLRMKLGLNRPKEEYEELLLTLASDDINNNNNIIKPGTKVKVKGLVNASEHNGKIGIVTDSKVYTSSITGEEHRRVGVKLSDNNGGTIVVAIKIKNLESASATMMTTTTNTNRPDPHEYLVGRKDGTVHIGSTPKAL